MAFIHSLSKYFLQACRGQRAVLGMVTERRA